MSTGSKVAVGFVVFMVVALVASVSSLMGINNTCVSLENTLKAQYTANQASYDDMYKKIVETAKVSESYSEKFKKVYDSMLEGRYGDEGSKAVFQMITESNPTLDSSIYKQVQQIIESSRTSFTADQKTLVDKKRVYENYLDSMPYGIVARMMGFPKNDLSNYDVVTSQRTKKAFDTKMDEPMDIGPKEN